VLPSFVYLTLYNKDNTGVRQISTRKSDIEDILKKYFVMLATFSPNMGGLSDKSDIINMLYHTNKIYINILVNLEK
jgi:hypothetical protein